MSSLTLDPVSDTSGAELVRLARNYYFPDFVKFANLDETRNPKGIPNHLYADPIRKQFPCHSAAATWLSSVYFHDKKASIKPALAQQIEQRLEKYARYWDIEEPYEYIKYRKRRIEKEAQVELDDTDFAYVAVRADGVKERRLPLRNAAEVKAACDWLYNYRDQIPFRIRHNIANKILEKAAEYGAGLGDKLEFIEQQTGRGIGDPNAIVGMIAQRASLLPPTYGQREKFASDGTPLSLRGHFARLAQTLREQPQLVLQPDTLLKLAETIDTLDRQQRFVLYYDQGLKRPEEVIFQVTYEKLASDRQQLVSTNSGKVYEKHDLTKLAVSDLTDLFGPEFAERVTNALGEIDSEKIAEEVEALPRPEAELLDKLLAQRGVKPVMDKSAQDARITQSWWKQHLEDLSDMYGIFYQRI